jgi:phenylpropionate dioxygenase-like ring-hydroxylating dioxygenase large terminal subunit
MAMSTANPATHQTETGPHALDEIVQEGRVHRTAYTETPIFEREMERIFGGTWTFVAHESEIPKPNDFIRKRLGLRPIIVTRDRSNEFHVLMNRCTHRGATVCRLESGNARRFVCPYHNWTFQNNGEVATVPLDEAYGPETDLSSLRLGRARAESYRGFIFATMNPEMPPLEEHLGNAAPLIDQWLDRWPGAKLVVRNGEHRMIYKGNWKLVYDNAHDAYHAGFSHASQLRMRADRYSGGFDYSGIIKNLDKTGLTANDLGNGNTFVNVGDRPGRVAQRSADESAWSQAAPMPGQQAYEKIIRERLGADADKALDVATGSAMNLNIFPNLLLIGNQVQVIEPISVDQTNLIWYSTTLDAPDLPAEVNSIRMRLQEDFPSFGEPDDLANFEECHLALATVPEMEWVYTNRHLTTGKEVRDENGVLTGVVTDELCIRAFWRRWKELLQDETKLDATGVGR